MAGKN